MKIKLTAIALSAVMMTGLLSACGASGDKDTAKPADKGQATEQPKQVTLKFYHWYDEKIEKFDMLFAEFNKKYPNIKIESVVGVVNDANETMKKIDLAAASGESIDIVDLNSPSNFAQRAAIGLLEPLNDYLTKDGIKYADEFKSDYSVNGKYYALPGKVNQYFVMLNKTHLDEAGLPVPKEWTWDEYLDYAKKMTKGEGAQKRYGTYFHTWVDYAMLPLMGQIDNNSLIKRDGTQNVDNDLFSQGLQLRDRAMKDGSAIPYADTISQKLHYRNVYMNGQASMIEIGSWMIPEAAGEGPIKQTFKTVFAPYPTAKKGDPIASKTDGDFLAVGASSKHKQEAYTFVKWMATEGIVLQGKYLSGWKKADMNKLIDSMTVGANADKLVDKESLKYVLDVTKSAPPFIPVPYQAELEKALTTEQEKMLLGNQSVDDAIKNARTKIKDLIKANSK
ncbi:MULTISPECIES: ABC transporter substrate-binding protein [unclassified Paenibacillus]|uniref:ABC transporter substrate-binding protein n=1 Tax=unclassified Paenibacillus TaxID=185978 RepID=UPI002786FFF0|nr:MULTISPECIES: sugar ABC transporter substrate-binding protein [unclassified Paenibacillus]MDQ0902086.1 multiple sugar transport system substrate-binding protein [Paenibacillus sp. V4I7]MDQ0919420.1 multiple sugar transport system substrate-binding protein [Paenibacillus sp. V4I5]